MNEFRKLKALLVRAVMIKTLERICVFVLLAFLCCFAVVGCFVLFDPFVRFSDFSRLFWGICFYIISVIGTLFGVLWPYVRRSSEENAAVSIENVNPEANLNNGLINAYQLYGRLKDDPGKAPFLELLMKECATKLSNLNLKRVFNGRRLKKFIPYFLGFAVLFGAYWGFFPEYFTTSAKRLVLPWQKIEPIIRTKIYPLQDRKIRALKDEQLKIAAKISGEVPDVAFLKYSYVDDGWFFASRRVALEYDPVENIYFHVFETVPSDMKYYFEAGDNTTPTFYVESVDRPRIESIRYEYVYPSFTARSPTIEEGAKRDISAILGTKVRIKLSFNKPVEKCVLDVEGKYQIPLKGEDKNWSGSVKITGNDAFRFIYSDELGFSGKDKELFRIRLKADQPPNIDVVSSARSSQVFRKDKIDLEISARDDFGVGAMTLEIAQGQGPAEESLAQWVYRPAEKQVSERFSVDLEKDLAPSVYSFKIRITAWDANDIEGAHKTVKELGPFVVLSAAQIRMKEFSRVVGGASSLRGLIMRAYLLVKAVVVGSDVTANILESIVSSADGLLEEWKESVLELERLDVPVQEFSNLMRSFSQVVSNDFMVWRKIKKNKIGAIDSRDIEYKVDKLWSIERQFENYMDGFFDFIYADELENIKTLQQQIMIAYGQAARDGEGFSRDTIKAVAAAIGSVEQRIKNLMGLTPLKGVEKSSFKEKYTKQFTDFVEVVKGSSVFEALDMQKKAVEENNITLAAQSGLDIVQLLEYLASGGWKGDKKEDAKTDIDREKLISLLTARLKVLKNLSSFEDASLFELDNKKDSFSPELNAQARLMALRGYRIVSKAADELFEAKNNFPQFYLLGYEELRDSSRAMLSVYSLLEGKESLEKVINAKEKAVRLLALACAFIERNIEGLKEKTDDAKSDSKDELAEDIDVMIVVPDQSIKLPVSDSLNIRIRVLSRNGVSRIILKYRISDEKNERQIVVGEPKSLEQEMLFDFVFPVNALNLEPGLMVKYHVEAQDLGVMEKKTASSDEHIIEMVSFINEDEEESQEQDSDLVRRVFDLLIEKQQVVNTEVQELLGQMETNGQFYYKDLEKLQQIEKKQFVLEKSLETLTHGLSTAQGVNQEQVFEVLEELSGILNEDFVSLKQDYEVLKKNISTTVLNRE